MITREVKYNGGFTVVQPGEGDPTVVITFASVDDERLSALTLQLLQSELPQPGTYKMTLEPQ